MDTDVALSLACLLITVLVILPVVEASRQRRASRESSAVATALLVNAGIVDDEFMARLRRLAIPETMPFEFARQFGPQDPALLADAAQRLALRLKRRAAFERKMLARTASGRRRGAIAAAVPPLVLLCSAGFGFEVPVVALVFVVCAEAFGCWLLWRLARVGI